MKKFFFLLALVSLGLVACNRNSQPVSEDEAYQKFIKNPGDGRTFGDKFDSKKAITYEELHKRMQDLKGADKLEVTVRGTVSGVCQAKGCWMTLQSPKLEDKLFVKFKDYAFFMPKDLSGQQVVMTGYAFKEVTSVDMLRHLAEDAGKSKDEIAAIKEPKQEYKFMASGVAIVE